MGVGWEHRFPENFTGSGHFKAPAAATPNG